jgi:hypothetical protein
MAMPPRPDACQRNKHEHRNNCYHNCNFYNGSGPSSSESNGEFKKRKKNEDVAATVKTFAAGYEPDDSDDDHDEDDDDGNHGVVEQSVSHQIPEIPYGCQAVEVFMTLRLVTSFEITQNEVNSAAAAAAASFRADVGRRMTVLRSIPTTPTNCCTTEQKPFGDVPRNRCPGPVLLNPLEMVWLSQLPADNMERLCRCLGVVQGRFAINIERNKILMQWSNWRQGLHIARTSRHFATWWRSYCNPRQWSSQSWRDVGIVMLI